MSGSNSISGLGTRFYIIVGETNTPVSEIFQMSFSGMERETIETTSLDTPFGETEYMGGGRTSGNITLSINFTRSMFDLFFNDYKSESKRGYYIVLPDNTSFTFFGYVSELPIEIPNETVVVEVTIEIVGEIEIGDDDPQEFVLTFANINNVPVTDPADVDDWNTFFNLPTLGTPFTSVVVTGNAVNLKGATSITGLSSSLFKTASEPLVSVVDTLGIVGIIGASCFEDQSTLLTAIFPGATSINSLSFFNTSLTTIEINACTSLGSGVGDSGVFGGVVGETIDLTVPAALMTNNGGNPDGDIAYLQANNTVTITQV